MGKAVAIGFALIIGLISFIGAASISSGGSNRVAYADADEEWKTKYLERISKGFAAGFRMTAGRSAEITDVYADGAYDLLSITVQLKDEKIEKVPFAHVEKQRQRVIKQTCKHAEKEDMLENGITLRVRFFRPSGGKFMTIEINEEQCVRYLARTA